MTVHDLACLLQTDVATVRRMTKERAQRQAQFPVPFFKINGKMLRFDRKKIQEWLQNMTAATPVFRPGKQKRGRKRRNGKYDVFFLAFNKTSLPRVQ
jgi:predicted DNA-binding transcriptional regulator AlpA